MIIEYLTTLAYQQGTSDKIYVVVVIAENAKWTVLRAWGKAYAKSLTSKSEVFTSRSEAINKYAKIVDDQVRQGYVKIARDHPKLADEAMSTVHPFFRQSYAHGEIKKTPSEASTSHVKKKQSKSDDFGFTSIEWD